MEDAYIQLIRDILTELLGSPPTEGLVYAIAKIVEDEKGERNTYWESVQRGWNTHIEEQDQRIAALEEELAKVQYKHKVEIVTMREMRRADVHTTRLDALWEAEDMICDQVCNQIVQELSGTDAEAAELKDGTTEWYHNIPDEEGISQPPLRCAAEPIRRLIAQAEQGEPQEAPLKATGQEGGR